MKQNNALFLSLKVEKADLDGIAMRDLSTVMHAYQVLLNNSFKSIAGTRTLGRGTSREFDIIAAEVRNGSIEFVTELISRAEQLTLPAIALLGPSQVIEVAVNVIKLFKLLAEKRRDGQTVKVEVSGHNNITVVGAGNNITIINSPSAVLDAAIASRNSLAEAALAVAEGRLKYFSVGGRDDESRQLIDKSTASIFESSFEIADQPIEFHANIFRFNKRTFKGKLSVPTSGVLAAGDYTFKVASSSAILSLIDSMKRVDVKVIALPEYIPLVDGSRKIAALQIINVER